LKAEDASRLKSLHEIVIGKLAKRNVDLRNVERKDPAISPLGHATQEFVIKQGLEGEKAKEIVKAIKGGNFKVQSALQDRQIRVTGKKKDELQEVIAFCRSRDFGVSLAFKNFRGLTGIAIGSATDEHGLSTDGELILERDATRDWNGALTASCCPCSIRANPWLNQPALSTGPASFASKRSMSMWPSINAWMRSIFSMSPGSVFTGHRVDAARDRVAFQWRDDRGQIRSARAVRGRSHAESCSRRESARRWIAHRVR
jgi:hypothetical protein